MRGAIITILLIISFVSIAQVNTLKTGKKFKTQGEAEDSWAKDLFKKEYAKQHYKKFDSTVVINNTLFKYKKKYFEVIYTKDTLKAIFAKGLLYPYLIEEDKLDGQDNFFLSDTLKITDFEEMKFLNVSPKQKRFRFWLFQKWLANPTVFFLELTNENATSSTNLMDFINGASLTFFKKGWIIM